MQKILIADDLPFMRLLIEECLEALVEKGVLLLTAENGQVALDMIVREKPDLVFLDVMMPVMNGYEVCHIVKKELNLNQVHIIMLTAKVQDSDLAKGGDCGADGYIAKPFMPAEIKGVAERVLNLE